MLVQLLNSYVMNPTYLANKLGCGCGPIKSGTAFDPDRLADVYWELVTQHPDHFERDRLVLAPDS